MSGEHIQIADSGQNLFLPNLGHDRLSFEKDRELYHKQDVERADIEENELHHDVDEKHG